MCWSASSSCSSILSNLPMGLRACALLRHGRTCARVNTYLNGNSNVNGNGNGNGNGVWNGAGPSDVAAAGTLSEAVPLKPMLVGPEGSNGARIEVELPQPAVERYMDPCEAGQLEACATDRIRSSLEEADVADSIAAAQRNLGDAGVPPAAAPSQPTGTPYASPGGRWSNFQKYSTFRVRHQRQVSRSVCSTINTSVVDASCRAISTEPRL